jgi:hypothetical protein
MVGTARSQVGALSASLVQGLRQAVNVLKSAPAEHLAESAAGCELLQLTEAVERALDPQGLAAYRGQDEDCT